MGLQALRNNKAVIDSAAERCCLDCDPCLHRQLAGLSQYVRQLCRLSLTHIKGHDGNAWNELADAVARDCAKAATTENSNSKAANKA